MSRLGLEIANASMVLDNELPSRQAAPTHLNQLTITARRCIRLQVRVSKAKRELKRLQKELKLEKKNEKALIREMAGGL